MYDQIKTEEYMPKKNGKNIIKIIGIVLGVILVIALIVFLIILFINSSNAKRKAKEEEIRLRNVEETLSIESPKVITLYNYVTYGRSNNNKNYFVTNRNVDIENFDNAEKIFYATQFLEPDNFLDTGKMNGNKKVYAVAIDEFESALKRFFGSVIDYNREGSYRIVLPFSKDGGNLVNLVYDSNLKSFTTTFDTVQINNNKIKPYYTKLTKAKKKGNTTTLTERIVYTSSQASGANTIINIYSDYAKTRLIESKTVANNTIGENTINIDNYLEKANTIEYKFKTENKKSYFVSSKIKS